jgi:hypothetical protein
MQMYLDFDVDDLDATGARLLAPGARGVTEFWEEDFPGLKT